MSIFQLIENCLERMSSSEWDNLREAASGYRMWHRREWWHNKYYRNNPPNDGDILQQPRIGKPEVPYRRKLFYPSPKSRFSLGNKLPVAYFSNDFGINCCETIEQFSKNPNLSFKELSEYLGGKGNPTPGWCGYPLNFHLASDSLILNVSSETNQFVMVLCNAGGINYDEIWQCFQSRDPEEKKGTQLISKRAEQMGFDGILYPSVRAPVDVRMPNMNLVVFKPDKVQPGLPPVSRLRRTHRKSNLLSESNFGFTKGGS
jgi:hypothetical protein